MSDIVIPPDDAGQVKLVLDIMASIVDEAGRDFRYDPINEMCWYVDPHTSTPSCLAGRVLHRLGVPLSVFAGQEGNEARELQFLDSPVWLAQDALEVLSDAQSVQDSHRSWGDALTAARQTAQELGYDCG